MKKTFERMKIGSVVMRPASLISPRMRHLPAAVAHARLGPEALRKKQLADLRAALAHAGGTVPYWRDLFASLRFDPSGLRDTRDLEALPVLTKEIIRDQGPRLISDEHARERLILRRTGGSAGEPLTFYVDSDSFERQMAIYWRDFLRVGAGIADVQAKIWGYGRGHRSNVLAPVVRRLYLDAFRSGEAEMRRWHAQMERCRVEVVYGYASSVFAFARFLESERLALPRVRVVCVTAERLHPEMRRAIAEGFAAPVIDMYGAHETVRLASECLCGGMHIDTDAAVLEFVDDERSPAEGSRILLTTLLSRAMPFIRYELGDRATPLNETCPCGEHLPLMALSDGREHQVFEFQGGAAAHTTLFTKELYRLDGVARFQVRRVARDAVDLLVVPARGGSERLGAELLEIADRCRAAAGGRISVAARLVDDIPRTPRGKQPIVFSEWREAT